MRKITLLAGMMIMVIPRVTGQDPDTLKHYDLEEVKVSVTRMNTPLREIPQKVEIIDKKVISSVPSENMAELLKRTTNLDIVQYTGLSSAIGMRGFSPSSHARSYTLMLIDGKPAGTTNLATISTENIERIEIIKGPYSVLYGSDAMGGVINIITTKSRKAAYGSIQLEAGSFGSLHRSMTAGGKIADKMNIGLGYARREQSKDYRIGGFNLLGLTPAEKLILDKASYNDVMQNSTFQVNHVNGSLTFTPDEDWEISTEVLYSYANDVETPGNYWGSYGTSKRDFGLLNLYGTVSRNHEKGSFSLSPYYTKEIGYDYDNDSDSGFINYISNVQQYGLKMQENRQLGIFEWLIGADLDIYDYHSERFSEKATPTSPYSPDYSNSKSALFTQLVFRHKGLYINAGLRYDMIYYQIIRDELLNGTGGSDTYHALNPAAGVQYTFPSSLKFHSSFGTAFSVPDAFKVAGYYSVSEYFADWDFWWISNYKGNPDLKPESSVTWDGGISYSGQEKLIYVDVTYFNTVHKDKIIESRMEGDTTTFINAERSYMNGIELVASTNLGNLFSGKFKLELYANFTFNLKSTVDDVLPDATGNDSIVTRDMLYTRRTLGNFGLYFDNMKGFSTRLNARYSGKRLEFDNFSLLRPEFTPEEYYTEGGYTSGEQILEMPHFLILDYSVFYTVGSNIRFGIIISNVLDENYNEKDGYPMPGRMISGSFTYSF